MLHRNIPSATALRACLDDLLADLTAARREGNLSRLALVAYCEVRRWARQAGETELAEIAQTMITETPHASREDFLARMDTLIAGLEQARERFPDAVAQPRAVAH